MRPAVAPAERVPRRREGADWLAAPPQDHLVISVVAREHRLRRALSSEKDGDTPEQKQRKRSVALRRHQALGAIRVSFGLLVAALLYFGIEQLLRLFLCPTAPGDSAAIADFCACVQSATSAADVASSIITQVGNAASKIKLTRQKITIHRRHIA